MNILLLLFHEFWILSFLDLRILLGFYFLQKQPLRISLEKGCS